MHMPIEYKGYKIEMKGLNHFECRLLRLYGYSNINSIKRMIDKAIIKQKG